MVPELLRLCGEGKRPLGQLITTDRFVEINTAVAEVTAGKVAKPVPLL
jgi:Zn-dependent alcohol dehydrogenase